MAQHLLSERSFQLWAYSVSHCQLLIRSPRTANDTENIDIAFYGVTFLQLPTNFLGLLVEDGSPEELARITSMVTDPLSVGTVYALTSGGKRSALTAAGISVSRNTLEFSQTDMDFMPLMKPGYRVIPDP